MTLDNFVSSNVLSADALQPTTIATTWATPLMMEGRSTASSLLFVDAGVSDCQSLAAAAAQPGTEVHLLSSTQDAIGQITNTLLGRSGIASISILSHGADGALDFAGGALSLGNLGSHLGELKSWQQALAAGADILLYGCDVAADAVGQSFVNQIGAATGADVAASSNLTRSAALGGDWVLEYQTGTIEAAALVVANYASVLATFNVTNTNDAGAGSLRDAISQANTVAGADTINFTGSIFKDAVPDQITLTTGQLSITSDITIKGTGASKLSISGNNNSRVFSIASGNVTISGLLIIQGLADAGNSGGGILNSGTLTLSSSTVSGNLAGIYGGGIYNIGGGTLTLNNSTVSGNTSNFGGGGIYTSGTLTLKNSTVSGNTSKDGGGIFNDRGTLTVNNSTVSGNTASSFGGGIFSDRGALTVNNSTVSGNTATIYGGGIYNNGTLTVKSSTLTGNKAVSGGGIFNSRSLALSKSILSGNTATASGGGIYNDDFGGATLDISSTNIKGNTAPLGANIYSV
jgi:predicted outer membrane repeat protein